MERTSEQAAPTTVAVIDDDRQLCELITDEIADQPDLECVGAAHVADAAEDLVESTQPDVILVDLMNVVPGHDPATAVDWIGRLAALSGSSQVLVWTSWINWSGNLAEEYRMKLHAHEAGASEWLAKDNLAGLLASIRAAAERGPRSSDGAVTPLRAELEALLDRIVAEKPKEGRSLPGDPKLTPTELQVIPHLASGFEDGMSVAEIAHRIGMNPSTLEKHKKNVYAKWDVHSQPSFIKAARLRDFT